jgi:uncharacterized protein YebE (UPF0316 family)
MIDGALGPIIIMCMRICDMTIDTFRMILVVQGRKYYAALAGFFEILIWAFAIRMVFQHLDNIANLFGYATGYAIGNILGITIEQKVGLGFVQITIISKYFTDVIANKLREMKQGVTILPGEGGAGGVALIMAIVSRKYQREIIKVIESVDKEAFITVQSAMPFRGYIHGMKQ